MASRDISIEMPPLIKNLVLSGVVTFHCDYSRDGPDFYFRSVLQHPRLGIRTNQSMTTDEVYSAFGPGSKYAGKTAKTQAPYLSFGLTPNPDIVVDSHEKALQRAGLKNLNVLVRNGSATTLPKDSLSYWDVGREDFDDFVARCFLVASQIGNSRIRSRIMSDPAFYSIGGKTITDLKEWWFKADATQRWGVLTSSKKMGIPPSNGSGPYNLKPTYVKRLEMVPCPFSAPSFEIPLSSEEDEDEEGEPADEYDYTSGAALY